MNNLRIKELAIKYADENRPGSFVKYDPLWFEHYNLKFTELLVQECIGLCMNVNGDLPRTEPLVAASIRKYFGVE